MATDINGTVLARGGLLTDVTLDRKYDIGKSITDEFGNVYEYVKFAANVAVTRGYVFSFVATGANLLDTDTAATILGGTRVGVALGTLAAQGSGINTYGWLQVKTGSGQFAPVRTNASCAAGAGLAATSVGGEVDDAAGTADVLGMSIQTATGGAAAVNEYGVLNFPSIILVGA